MIDKGWSWFTSQGFKGSVSVKNTDFKEISASGMFASKANTPDDDTFIHMALYEMDPDYRTVAIIKQAGTKSAEAWAEEAFPDGIIEVSFAGSAEDIQKNLDNAILEGLAHRKVLIVRESGDVVKFGYSEADLF